MHVAGGLEPRADSFFPTLPLLSTLFTSASAAEGPLFGRLSASAAEAPSTPAREASWSGDGGDLGAPLEPFEEKAGSEVRTRVLVIGLGQYRACVLILEWATLARS